MADVAISATLRLVTGPDFEVEESIFNFDNLTFARASDEYYVIKPIPTVNLHVIRSMSGSLSSQTSIDADMSATRVLSATLELVTAISADLTGNKGVDPLPNVRVEDLIVQNKVRKLFF